MANNRTDTKLPTGKYSSLHREGKHRYVIATGEGSIQISKVINLTNYVPVDATITDTTLPVVITIVFFCFFFSTRKHFSFSHLTTISHYESLVIMQDLLSRFDLLFLEYSCELSGPSAVSSIKYEQTICYQNFYSLLLPENKRLPLAEVY